MKKQALSEESVESILSEIDEVLKLFSKNDPEVEEIFKSLGKAVSSKVSQKLR